MSEGIPVKIGKMFLICFVRQFGRFVKLLGRQSIWLSPNSLRPALSANRM